MAFNEFHNGPYAFVATWQLSIATPPEAAIQSERWRLGVNRCQTEQEALLNLEEHRGCDGFRNMWAGIYEYETQRFLQVECFGHPETFRDFRNPHVPNPDIVDVTPTTPPSPKGNSMVNLQVKREGGKLYLYVNAKELHDTLDAVGAQHDGRRYLDRPAASVAIAEPTRHQISTEVLLDRSSYPVKYNLSEVYREPPSIQNIRRLCESAHEQTRKVLEHYQPIDISIDIQKKVLK